MSVWSNRSGGPPASIFLPPLNTVQKPPVAHLGHEIPPEDQDRDGSFSSASTVSSRVKYPEYGKGRRLSDRDQEAQHPVYLQPPERSLSEITEVHGAYRQTYDEEEPQTPSDHAIKILVCFPIALTGPY